MWRVRVRHSRGLTVYHVMSGHSMVARRRSQADAPLFVADHLRAVTRLRL